MTLTSVEPKPISQGNYVLATRVADQVFTAGMTPRRNGQLIATGPVRSGQDLEDFRQAACLSVANALSAAREILAQDERIGRVLSMTVYVAADADFERHSRIADFASDYLFEELGPAGIGARTAVGVYTLPGRAPIEISLVVQAVAV